MIKYNLRCENKHEFESWFSDSNEFEKLKKKKLLDCIYCKSKKINKSIMSPMVSGVKEKENFIRDLSLKNFTQIQKNKLSMIKIAGMGEKFTSNEIPLEEMAPFKLKESIRILDKTITEKQAKIKSLNE